MRTSTTVGSTNVSSLFRQTPDLISPLLLLILGKSFFSFLFFPRDFYRFPIADRPSLFDRTDQTTMSILTLPISPPPLLKMFRIDQMPKFQFLSLLRLFQRETAGKKEEGVVPFEVQLIISLFFSTGLSLLCVSCVNARVFRAACHAWLFINLTNCAESVCLCVCVERTLALLVKRRDGQMRATNEWLAVAPFVSPFFGLEQKFFDLISLGRDNSKPRK